MTHKNDRVLAVAELVRVEGEGAMYIRASGKRAEEARRDIVERGLAPKKAGNAVKEVVGGRARAGSGRGARYRPPRSGSGGGLG